jgi:hypothetical protein
LLCVNIPPNVTIEEIRVYFNTLLGNINPDLYQLKEDPIKNVELSHDRKFALLYCASKKAK